MGRIVQLLGSPPVSSLALTLSGHHLRTLTYHRVPDAQRFAAQLDCLATWGFRTLTGEEVVAWLGGARLGRRLVWITFDDGDPTVISAGLPALADRGMHATAFVCPGLVDTSAPHWWDVVERAHARRVAGDDPDHVPTVGQLKLVDDDERRRIVGGLIDGPGVVEDGSGRTQWSAADIAAWLAAGNEIGNHTWDHPCLDRCTPAVQADQVRRAHGRLTELVGAPPRSFAWPNGNVAPAVAPLLRELGYQLVVACDHRLTTRRQGAQALSRLKLDSDVGLGRFRSIISGAHSGVFHATAPLRALPGRIRSGLR